MGEMPPIPDEVQGPEPELVSKVRKVVAFFRYRDDEKGRSFVENIKFSFDGNDYIIEHEQYKPKAIIRIVKSDGSVRFPQDMVQALIRWAGRDRKKFDKLCAELLGRDRKFITWKELEKQRHKALRKK